MIDAITLELYRDIAQSCAKAQKQAQNRYIRESRTWGAMSATIAGLGTAIGFSTGQFLLSGVSIGVASAYLQKKFESDKQLRAARSYDSGMLTRLYYHPGGFVTLNSGSDLEEIVDGRSIVHAGLELGEQATLVTNVEVDEAIGRSYARIADMSFETNARVGSYDWMVVRRSREKLALLVPDQNNGTTLASTSTV